MEITISIGSGKEGLMGASLAEILKSKPVIEKKRRKKKKKKVSELDAAIRPKVGAKKQWEMEQV
jgi:hypothetical protein